MGVLWVLLRPVGEILRGRNGKFVTASKLKPGPFKERNTWKDKREERYVPKLQDNLLNKNQRWVRMKTECDTFSFRNISYCLK